MAFAVSIFYVGFIVIAWFKNGPGWRFWVTTVVGAMVAFLFGATFFFGTFYRHRHYIAIQMQLRKSQCEVVEGTVTQFQHISPDRGLGPGETFVVNGVKFRYRQGSAQSGFHQVGVIQNGMQVRICYDSKSDPVDKDIARLEIAETD